MRLLPPSGWSLKTVTMLISPTTVDGFGSWLECSFSLGLNTASSPKCHPSIIPIALGCRANIQRQTTFQKLEIYIWFDEAPPCLGFINWNTELFTFKGILVNLLLLLLPYDRNRPTAESLWPTHLCVRNKYADIKFPAPHSMSKDTSWRDDLKNFKMRLKVTQY